MICLTCGGNGTIVTCYDDICVGIGHCIHGDGEETCPDCGGEGEIFEDEEDDYYDDDDYYPDEFDFPTEEEEARIEEEEYKYCHGICLTCGGAWGDGWSTCTCEDEQETE